MRNCPSIGAGLFSMNTKEFCVYTVMIGEYENLNEQNVESTGDIDWFCFTDRTDLDSQSWTIVKVDPIFAFDPIRSQRFLKMSPEIILSEYKNSIYIDNSIIFKASPRNIFELFDQDRGIMLAKHSFRDTVLDEFLAVSSHGMDEQSKIFEQLNHYLLDDADALAEKPFWGGLIVRNHLNPQVRRLHDLWKSHVNRYARRDQLSLNYCLRAVRLDPQELEVDNHESVYHSWPHDTGRDRYKGMRQISTSLLPLAVRYKELEKALDNSSRRILALEDENANNAARLRALHESTSELQKLNYRLQIDHAFERIRIEAVEREASHNAAQRDSADRIRAAEAALRTAAEVRATHEKAKREASEQALSESAARLDALAVAYQEMTSAYQLSVEARSSLRRTLSWRVTKPLRFFGRMITSKRHS